MLYKTSLKQSINTMWTEKKNYHLELIPQLDSPLPKRKHPSSRTQRAYQECDLLLVQVPN